MAMAMAADKCYTTQDVKTNVCWALCRQDGYDTGAYEQKTDSCICGQRKEYKEYTQTVLKIIGPIKEANPPATRFYLRDE